MSSAPQVDESFTAIMLALLATRNSMEALKDAHDVLVGGAERAQQTKIACLYKADVLKLIDILLEVARSTGDAHKLLDREFRRLQRHGDRADVIPLRRRRLPANELPDSPGAA